jgi:hypothetical protein
MTLSFKFFAFCERKLDILNLKHSTDLLFLMTANFIECCEFSVMLHIWLGLVLSDKIH